MQKKIIALAVAGLVSGAAFAQTNVTIYGTLDMAVQHSWSHTTNGVGSKTSVDQVGWDSSRFGFLVKEELGNGLSALGEMQFRPRTDIRSSGLAVNRQWLGLQSKSWGMIKAGTFANVLDDINGYSEVGNPTWGKDVIDIIRGNDTTYNQLQYVSNDMSGFTFKLGVSSNDRDLDDGENKTNLRSYSGLVSYANGPLKVAVAYDQKKDKNDGSTDAANAAQQKSKQWLLSGAYDFGMVKLGLGYTRVNNDGVQTIDGSDFDKKAAYRINLGIPVGAANQIGLSYQRAKFYDVETTGQDEKASGFGLSFTHFMSKRTAFYAAYGQVSQDDGAGERVGTNGVNYEKMIKAGIRHQF